MTPRCSFTCIIFKTETPDVSDTLLFLFLAPFWLLMAPRLLLYYLLSFLLLCSLCSSPISLFNEHPIGFFLSTSFSFSNGLHFFHSFYFRPLSFTLSQNHFEPSFLTNSVVLFFFLLLSLFLILLSPRSSLVITHDFLDFLYARSLFPSSFILLP